MTTTFRTFEEQKAYAEANFPEDFSELEDKDGELTESQDKLEALEVELKRKTNSLKSQGATLQACKIVLAHHKATLSDPTATSDPRITKLERRETALKARYAKIATATTESAAIDQCVLDAKFKDI